MATAAPGGDKNGTAIDVVVVDMRDVDAHVQWAQQDEYFARGFAAIVNGLFAAPDAYAIYVGDINVAEAYDMTQRQVFRSAVESLLTEALFYVHLFPVVVFKVRKEPTPWLLALGQAPRETREALQLPVAVQALGSREGQLVYTHDRRTNERAYVWVPANAADSQYWDFHCYTLPAVTTVGIEPIVLASSAAATNGRQRRGVLPSPFRQARLEARDLEQFRRNRTDAEGEVAHPRVFFTSRPQREIAPEALSVQDLLSADSLSGAGAREVFLRQKQLVQFLIGTIDEYRDALEAVRTSRDRNDTPQAEYRRAYGLMDVLDQAVPLPETVAGVHMPQPTYNVDVAAETDRYARMMALRLGNLPASDVMGDAAIGTTSAGPGTKRGVSGAMLADEEMARQRETALQVKRSIVGRLWSFAYAVGLARTDFAALVELLYALDETQYQAKARDILDTLHRTRTKRVAALVHQNGGDEPASALPGGGGGGDASALLFGSAGNSFLRAADAAAEMGAGVGGGGDGEATATRLTTKAARRLLGDALTGTTTTTTSAPPVKGTKGRKRKRAAAQKSDGSDDDDDNNKDERPVPTLSELRAELTRMLETDVVPVSTFEFTPPPLPGTKGDQKLEKHESLPEPAQEMRFKTLQLLQKAAADGNITSASFARAASQLFDLKLDALELPVPEPPAKRARTE